MQATARFRFWHRLRVRWAEVDMQKIVFNAHYLMYLDTAIAAYWRALALPYEAAMLQLGGDLYLKKAELEYHASARSDDELDIGLSCAHLGNSSMRFRAAVQRDENLLVSAELIYVYADPANQRSQPLPAPLRAILTDYEAGHAVSDLHVGSWEALGPPSTALREQVFVQEQGIGAAMVWDDADANAVHALVLNRLHQPLAAGRLLQPEPGVGRIGRMAVVRGLRGAGLGRQVLQALLEVARARGDHTIVLHAQTSAEPFYRTLGFTAEGPVFEEAGIRHVIMTRALTEKVR